MGSFLLLDIISAAIIGGASFNGGKGSVIGTLFGVIVIALIANCLSLLGVSFQATMIVKGGIIFVAVILDGLKTKLIQ